MAAASPTLRALLALLLVLSVGAKIVVAHGDPSRDLEGTMHAVKGGIAAFLDRQGFQVGIDESQPESPFVTGAAGDCRLLAVYAAPEGWHRDVVRQLATRHDQVFFVVEGAVHPDQPVRLTWMRHYWRKLNRFAGRDIPARPVLGVIASPSCDLRDMPWRELPGMP